MGKVIRKMQSMNWWSKTTLVLLLTLATSAGIMPRGAEASVAPVNAWPATPQIVSNAATGTVTGTVTVGAGTNRVMLVVVGAEYTATPATQPITVNYGGQPVIQLQNNFAGPNTIWLGFINEAGLAKATSTTLSVTNGNTTNLTAMYASAAVFSGVDQTVPISGSNSVSSGATAVTLMNLPPINVKGTTTPSTNTALSFYISNWNLQLQTVDPAYTQTQQYSVGTNFYMAFNTITTPPTSLITSAPAVQTTGTAALGSAVSVGLVPAGVTGIGAVGTCSACHGYPPVDNSTRNGATGTFPGSHNKHTGTGTNQYGFLCTRCHVDNRTFNHQTGTINMASPYINGDTGATYGKGTSFAVSNAAFSGNTCSNTYCHSNGTGGTNNTPSDPRGIVANTSPTWGTSTGNNFATNCSTACHNGRPAYTSYTGATVINGSKANSHQATTHSQQTCDVCHYSVSTPDSGVTYTTYSSHNNRVYSLKTSLGYSYGSRGGTCATPGCHGQARWGGKLGCVNCHNQNITRTKGRPNEIIPSIVAEFANTWSHKRTAGGTVTDADCIVCHLEGDSTTGKVSATYHQNGNIDLRDPDGATTEAAITNMSGAAFTFARFTTTFVAGSRTTTGNTSNNIDNVITQKFCLKCHDANGATNTGSRVGGAATSQYKPFNTTITGASYVTPLSAGVAGGVVDVDTQFATTNSSFHPVKGAQNNSYAQGTKMVAPFGVTKTNGTPSNGVVITCFDCHNVVGNPLTQRTVTAHGNAVTLRGVPAVSGTPASTNGVTLCRLCHNGYYGGTANSHSTGSAFNTSTDSGMTAYVNYGCNICHSSGFTTAVPRPIRGQDTHGSNALGTVGTLITATNRWATDATPIAFIRNRQVLPNQQPKQIGARTFTPSCMGGSTNPCSQGTQTYAPGGVY